MWKGSIALIIQRIMLLLGVSSISRYTRPWIKLLVSRTNPDTTTTSIKFVDSIRRRLLSWLVSIKSVIIWHLCSTLLILFFSPLCRRRNEWNLYTTTLKINTYQGTVRMMEQPSTKRAIPPISPPPSPLERLVSTYIICF